MILIRGLLAVQHNTWRTFILQYEALLTVSVLFGVGLFRMWKA